MIHCSEVGPRALRKNRWHTLISSKQKKEKNKNEKEEKDRHEQGDNRTMERKSKEKFNPCLPAISVCISGATVAVSRVRRDQKLKTRRKVDSRF